MPRPRVRRMHGGGNPRFGGGEAEAEEKSVVVVAVSYSCKRRGEEGWAKKELTDQKRAEVLQAGSVGFCSFESHNNNNIPNCLFLGFNSN